MSSNTLISLDLVDGTSITAKVEVSPDKEKVSITVPGIGTLVVTTDSVLRVTAALADLVKTL